MRFDIAMNPSTITRMTAIGVAHANMFDCSDSAPVRNGDSCAKLTSGAASIAAKSKSAAATRIRDKWRVSVTVTSPFVLLTGHIRSRSTIKLYLGIAENSGDTYYR